MNGYYSVFNPRGEKIADCGTLRDATTLVGMRGEGHYYQFRPILGDIIDINSDVKQLPTRDIVVTMNNGKSWTIESQQKLPESDLKTFNS